jgi:anthranilate phosphoribosyltransferase
VHGAGGLDELSTLGHTKVSEVYAGMVNTFYLHPTDAGLRTATVNELAGGDAVENSALVTRVLAGETGPRRDIVLLNAGAALLVAGVADSLPQGVRLAAESIDSGAARRVLANLREVTSA